MITTEHIDQTLQQLEKKFRSSVDGPATKLVAGVDPKAKAFGQHLDPASDQRGLHGTAAAMYVFSSSREERDREALLGLVHYCAHRQEIETAIDAESHVPVPLKRLAADEVNVIKLSELLYGLSNAKTRAGVQAYAQSLAHKLANGMADTNGWSYLLNGPVSVRALLPTSWAVLALVTHGYHEEVEAPVRYLEQELANETDEATDIAVKVFALYVLLRVDRERGTERRGRKWHKRKLHEYLDTLGPLLNQALETNIEYLWPPESRVLYVRVPWQLYLTACAAELSPYRGFASRSMQTRLEAIVRQVNQRGGLIYPHSGDMISSRTNAILYETFRSIKHALEVRHLPLRPFMFWSRLGEWANSAVVRGAARLFALGVMVFAIQEWIRADDFNWGQIAPEFVTALLLFLVAGRR